MSWRRESDKEVAQLSEQHTCELCGSAVDVVSSGEGTNSYRPVESERMTKLERLVEDAHHWMEYAANNINPHASVVAEAWLARYREMFTSEVK